MTITACPIALNGTGRCRNIQCHLRHDVVHCKQCKCFVLHGDLRKHRRGEDHRLNSGFGGWKAYAKRPARAILPSHYYPYVPQPQKPSEKRARKLAKKKALAKKKELAKEKELAREKERARKKELARRKDLLRKKELQLAGTRSVSARGVEAQDLSVSGEEGLDFKSEVDVDKKKKKKKTNSMIPVIIQKTADGVGLSLVGVVVTGAGSGGFSAKTERFPIKMKGKKQRTVQVSFAPRAAGEWDAQLELRFLHVSNGKRVTLTITRRLHGVATYQVADPRLLTPQKCGYVTPTPGVCVSQKYPGSSGNMQLRGTRLRQLRDTERDSSY